MLQRQSLACGPAGKAATVFGGTWVPQKSVMSSNLMGEIKKSCANNLYFLRTTLISCDPSLSVPRSKRWRLPNKQTRQHTGKYSSVSGCCNASASGTPGIISARNGASLATNGSETDSVYRSAQFRSRNEAPFF